MTVPLTATSDYWVTNGPAPPHPPWAAMGQRGLMGGLGVGMDADWCRGALGAQQCKHGDFTLGRE